MNDRIKGAVFGAVIGDILGLKYEGLSPIYINKDNIGNKTFFNFHSDDTEHLILTANSILSSNDIKTLQFSLRNNFQKWLFTLPFGIGQATIKSLLKSFIKKESGVDSAGNGALMRSGAFGLILNNSETLKMYVEKTTVITHNNKEAIDTSVLYSQLIHYILYHKNTFNTFEFLSIIKNYNNEKINLYISDIEEALNENRDPFYMMLKWSNLNRGAFGYTLISFALSIYTFLLYKDNFEQGMIEIIYCGGDTDTNAFLFGMLSGSYCGFNNLPKKYVDKISYSLSNQLEALCEDIYVHNPTSNFNFFFQFLKNLFTFPIVFIEIIKRIFIFLFKLKI